MHPVHKQSHIYQTCTFNRDHLSVLLFEVLEETALEGFRPALDSEYHDGDDDAKQNDGKSNDQAVHILIVVEELGDHLIVAGQHHRAGTDGVDQQRDRDVLAESCHLYQNIDIKSCPTIFDIMRSGLLWLLATILALGTCAELQEALNCLNEYMESLRDTMSPRLFEVFKKSYPNTLETTIKNYDLTPGKQSAYIITGDIQAMWLRDSTNQFLPYIRIPKECTHIRALARGLINTQAQLIMLDPYTNAFKKFQTQISARHFYLNDKTTALVMGIPVDLCRQREFATKGIWQRKFQIDSLASFLRLAYEYQLKYGTIDFLNIRVIKAIRRILSVVDEQTKDLRYETQNKRKFYTFFREPRELPNGQISASSSTGMIKTGFRPSDDPNTHPYNIPGNAMMSTYLQLVAQKVLDAVPKGSVFKREAMILSSRMKASAKSIRQAIYEFGVLEKDGKKVFAYEVNGRGDSVIFDDANLPSLVSLAYLGFVSLKDQVYSNTRAYMLSNKNPFFYENQQYKGIGSSHTPVRTIWPLALITQILTSNNDDEIKQCLKGLLDQANDNLMHESFSIDNPRIITRTWFAWANSLFGEAIIKLATERPDLLK